MKKDEIKYKVLLVDDEHLSRLGTQLSLEKIFSTRSELLQVFEASNTKEAEQMIKKHQPDLLLLDIEMPNENGIDFLARLNTTSFHVIFLTAYSEYAIEAFKFHAMDYLLKPFNDAQLEQAISKCIKFKELHHHAAQYKDLKDMLYYSNDKKINVPTQEGVIFIRVNTIRYLKAEGSYTVIHYSDSQAKKLTASRNLKSFERVLHPSIFVRIHDACIVNKNYIDRFVKGDGGYIVLEDGTHLDLSKRKKHGFLKFMNESDTNTIL